MVRSMQSRPQARPLPDPIRVVAISAAIAANAAMFALLMMPPAFDIPVAHESDAIQATIIPPPDKKVEVVKIEHQKPLPPTPTQTHAVPHETHIVPAVVTREATNMSIAVPPLQIDETVGLRPEIVIRPPSATSLVPIVSPAPTYPRTALTDEVFGTVELELLVGTDGRVVSVQVVHSSGDRRLDSAARDQVLRNWRFQPAMRDGVAVEARGRLPVVFSLDGR